MSLFGKPKAGGFMDEIRCDEPSYLIWKWHPAGSGVIIGGDKEKGEAYIITNYTAVLSQWRKPSSKSAIKTFSSCSLLYLSVQKYKISTYPISQTPLFQGLLPSYLPRQASQGLPFGECPACRKLRD